MSLQFFRFLIFVLGLRRPTIYIIFFERGGRNPLKRFKNQKSYLKKSFKNLFSIAWFPNILFNDSLFHQLNIVSDHGDDDDEPEDDLDDDPDYRR